MQISNGNKIRLSKKLYILYAKLWGGGKKKQKTRKTIDGDGDYEAINIATNILDDNVIEAIITSHI